MSNGRIRAAVLGPRFKIIAQRRGVRSKHFPTAFTSATAARTIGIERHMAKFSGHAAPAADELALRQDAGAYSLRNRDCDEIANLRGIEPHFG